jgi:acetoin utilization protein AcuB
MALSQTEIESRVIELTEKSLKTFCDDISGMFGVDMACNPQEVTPETVNGLRTRFKELAGVYSFKAEGTLDGTFKLVFDKKGLFILIGVVAMHPEQMILEDAEFGSLEKAEKLSNILTEVGTALTGSWNRAFRKGLDGHGRFVQTDTFIGNPWDCGAIFPKAIFAGISELDTEQAHSAEQKAREEVEQKPQVETEEVAQENTEEQPLGDTEEKAQEETTKEEVVEKTQEETESTAPKVSEVAEETGEIAQDKKTDAETVNFDELDTTREDTEQTTEHEEVPATADQAQPEDEETVAANESDTKQEPETAAEQKPNVIEEDTTPTAEIDTGQERPISETIKKMAKSPAVLPGESAPSEMGEKLALGFKDALLTICAKDIMQKDVIWGNPDDSVQQALAKIQQHNTSYIMIGQEQVPEGIVSKSDLTGALSPYLRNIFAKWRRPMDDATLQIKIKWIMSKPTCTISPETSLAKIIGYMYQTNKRCLPVVDDQGKVQGLVTVFDIFRVLL